MGASFGWGALAASSLVIGSIVALLFRIKLPTIGLIMGFGAGVLISAVAFDLVEKAAAKSNGDGWTIAGLFAGCAVFFGGDGSSTASAATTVRTQTARRRAARRWPSSSEPCSTGSPSRW